MFLQCCFCNISTTYTCGPVLPHETQRLQKSLLMCPGQDSRKGFGHAGLGAPRRSTTGTANLTMLQGLIICNLRFFTFNPTKWSEHFRAFSVVGNRRCCGIRIQLKEAKQAFQALSCNKQQDPICNKSALGAACLLITTPAMLSNRLW